MHINDGYLNYPSKFVDSRVHMFATVAQTHRLNQGYKYSHTALSLSAGPMAVRFQLIATVSYRTSTFLLSPPSPSTSTSFCYLLPSLLMTPN